MDDHERAERELTALEPLFRGTRNPALVRQWQALSKRARPDSSQGVPRYGGSLHALRVVSELAAVSDPAERALGLLI